MKGVQLKGPLYEKFEDIMSNDTQRQSFKNFLKTILCDELYDFYSDILNYESSTEDQRRQIAEKIYNNFLTLTSLTPVNINNDVRLKVEKIF